jgi:hypothetical protein
MTGEKINKIDPMEKTWNFDAESSFREKRKNIILALVFVVAAATTFICFALKMPIGGDAVQPGRINGYIKMVSILSAGLLLSAVMNGLKYRVYGLTANTVDNTLVLYRANMFWQYKQDIINLRDVATSVQTDPEGAKRTPTYTLSIIVNGKTFCKISDREFDWDKWTLEEVCNYIQKPESIVC